MYLKNCLTEFNQVNRILPVAEAVGMEIVAGGWGVHPLLVSSYSVIVLL